MSGLSQHTQTHTHTHTHTQAHIYTHTSWGFSGIFYLLSKWVPSTNQPISPPFIFYRLINLTGFTCGMGYWLGCVCVCVCVCGGRGGIFVCVCNGVWMILAPFQYELNMHSFVAWVLISRRTCVCVRKTGSCVAWVVEGHVVFQIHEKVCVLHLYMCVCVCVSFVSYWVMYDV